MQVPRDWQLAERAAHHGLGLGLGVAVPNPAVSTTPNFVSSAITVQPCHSVTLTVFPIVQGVVASDPATVLADLGFKVIGVLDGAGYAAGGNVVTALYMGASPYTSSASDAQNLLEYTLEAYPWANGQNYSPWQQGETVTGATSGATATIASVADDSPADGGGLMTLSNVTGTFQMGERITGGSSGNYATAVAYGAVMTSPKGNGQLGVTNMVDSGLDAAACVTVKVPPGGKGGVTPGGGPGGGPPKGGGGSPSTPGTPNPGQMSTPSGVSTGALLFGGAAILAVGGTAWYFLR